MPSIFSFVSCFLVLIPPFVPKKQRNLLLQNQINWPVSKQFSPPLHSLCKSTNKIIQMYKNILSHDFCEMWKIHVFWKTTASNDASMISIFRSYSLKNWQQRCDKPVDHESAATKLTHPIKSSAAAISQSVSLFVAVNKVDVSRY